MRSFLKVLSAIVALAVTTLVVATPASAALNPTYTVNYGGQLFGAPGNTRYVVGAITLGSADTYVTGGLTVTPANVGFLNNIAQFTPTLPFGTPYQPNVSYTVTAGSATLKIFGPQSGASNIAATATTATVSAGVAGLSANTPIACTLDDAATGGGGTGTWAVTVAVSSCKFVTATSFTITSTAAAPTNGGNFTWIVPTVPAEIPSATSVASLVIPFIAIGN